MASLAPCRSSRRWRTISNVRRKEGRKEGRRAAWQSKSQSTAAVPFQEVISEATAAVEAEGGGQPRFHRQKRSGRLPPFDQKFLVCFWICLLHGKVRLIGKKSVFQFYSIQAGAATVSLSRQSLMNSPPQLSPSCSTLPQSTLHQT